MEHSTESEVNIFNEGELDKNWTVAKNAKVQMEENREIIRDIV